MQPKPFVLRYVIEGVPFTLQFLASDDFDNDTLQNICKSLSLPKASRKNDLIHNIERGLSTNPQDRIAQIILINLIRRKKKWFTFRLGKIRNRPLLHAPTMLVFSEGKQEWYGPMTIPGDDLGSWYVRPHFPVHWEMDGLTPEPKKRQIRWLCFARVTDELVSLHWQGFMIAEEPNLAEREAQFPYWNYIPLFFDEIEKILDVQLSSPNLHDLVLIQLWERYRIDVNYTWTDLRIRAESGGVSLSARSAGADNVVDVDVKGIKHLARTLGLSVRRQLNLWNLDSRTSKRLEEAILGTLIREFGTKSYEFSLEIGAERLLKAHIYFGMRPNVPGPDSFPHVNCYTSWQSDRDQLMFILKHLQLQPTNVKSQSVQSSLF